MQTTLNAAVESYLRSKSLTRGTRNEYFSTLRKWAEWGGGTPIEQLRRRDIREFLDSVYQRAVEHDGMNPGRTVKDLRKTCATYYDEHLPESSIEILGHSVAGITYRHYALRAPLAFKVIMTIPQPTAFLAMVKGYDGECPCCRRRFADA